VEKIIIFNTKDELYLLLNKIASINNFKFSDAQIVMSKDAAMLSYRVINSDLKEYDTDVFSELIIPELYVIVTEIFMQGIEDNKINNGTDLFHYIFKNIDEITHHLYDKLVHYKENQNMIIGEYDFFKLAKKAVENNLETIVISVFNNFYQEKQERLEAAG